MRVERAYSLVPIDIRLFCFLACAVNWRHRNLRHCGKTLPVVISESIKFINFFVGAWLLSEFRSSGQLRLQKVELSSSHLRHPKVESGPGQCVTEPASSLYFPVALLKLRFFFFFIKETYTREQSAYRTNWSIRTVCKQCRLGIFAVPSVINSFIWFFLKVIPKISFNYSVQRIQR